MDNLRNVFRDLSLLRFVISYLIPISNYLGRTTGSFYCPFHRDEHHPSAKLFNNDSDGIERLFCFAEQKQYTGFDYVKIVLGKDPLTYLLSEFEEKQIIEAVSFYKEEDRINDNLFKAYQFKKGDSVFSFIEILYAPYAYMISQIG